MRIRILDYMKNEFSKSTPVFLISLAGIIFLSVAVISISLLPDQSAGLGVAYALMVILLLFVALLFDRIVVRKFNLAAVVKTEFASIAILFIWMMWTSRSTKLVVETNNDYFVVVFMDGGKTLNDFKYDFPFNK